MKISDTVGTLYIIFLIVALIAIIGTIDFGNAYYDGYDSGMKLYTDEEILNLTYGEGFDIAVDVYKTAYNNKSSIFSKEKWSNGFIDGAFRQIELTFTDEQFSSEFIKGLIDGLQYQYMKILGGEKPVRKE